MKIAVPNSWRRSLAVALAGLIVYQLGACSCGCLEHNLWLAVVDSFCPPSPTHSESKLPTSDEAIECPAHGHDHDCTDEATDYFLASGKQNSSASGLANASVAADLPTIGVSASELVELRRYHGQRQSGTPPVRADLQIFLL